MDRPENAADEQRSDAQAAGEPVALRVLIVEDNVDIAHVMKALVSRFGHEPRWAASADEALRECAAWQPQLGLIDIGLPGMDGCELASALRKDPRLSPLTLVALTGFGQQEDRRKTEQAGFNQHVVKPISVEVLQQILAQCVADVKAQN